MSNDWIRPSKSILCYPSVPVIEPSKFSRDVRSGTHVEIPTAKADSTLQVFLSRLEVVKDKHREQESVTSRDYIFDLRVTIMWHDLTITSRKSVCHIITWQIDIRLCNILRYGPYPRVDMRTHHVIEYTETYNYIC